MTETSTRTLVCSVLFVDVADFAHLPVTEQLRQKRVLNALLAKELARVSKAERVVHEIEMDGDQWTAVCDTGGAGR